MDQDGWIMIAMAALAVFLVGGIIGGAMWTDTVQSKACLDAGMQIIGGNCIDRGAP